MVIRILRLPRLIRILAVVFVALLLVMAIFPLVDSLYVAYFFNIETIVLPSLVSVAVGLIVYVWGWRSIVGMVGETPEPKFSAKAFISLALLLVLIDLGLILQGLAMTNWIAG
jgi:amino acid transporter